MRSRIAARLSACLLIAALTATAAAAASQDAPPIDAVRVRDLLVLLAAPDPRGALDAAGELQRMGPAVAPAVVEALKTDHACQVQWMASGVLRHLQLEPALVETTLIAMARGACRASSVSDLNLQQEAAVALIDRPRGIALMTELLRKGDLLARRRAAFAFDELTERLLPDHPRTIAATPEILAAAEAALRPLRDTAVSNAPAEVRCPAFDAIDQARRLPQAALASRATSLLEHARVDCGSPPGPSEGRAVTTRVGRQRLEDVIAGLDRQSPEQAAEASSALIAAGEDVVPLLQQRLRQTDRCRGLALVAGVLAARNTAPADVEAAFARVAAGTCAGDDPFDLTLAQSAADAFVVRPEGIARLTGLLGDRAVAVRRRAVRSLATLFERLGMGEHARPTADPAMLDAARASLSPLVAMATTERDGMARCQAVLAVQRAQQAQDDGLRALADAESRGRTLRCLAPPNP